MSGRKFFLINMLLTLPILAEVTHPTPVPVKPAEVKSVPYVPQKAPGKIEDLNFSAFAKIKGLIGEVYFNGFIITKTINGDELSQSSLVNHALFKSGGDNVLEFVVREIVDPKNAIIEAFVASHKDIKFDLKDKKNFNLVENLDFNWKYDPKEVPEIPFGTKKFQIIYHQFPHWKWQDVKDFGMTKKTRDESYDFLKEVLEVIKKGEKEKFALLAKVALEEQKISLRTDRDGSVDFFSHFGMGGIKIQVDKVEDYGFRHCCDRRLVHVYAKTGKPLFIDGNWIAELYIGKLDGKWQIIRILN